MWGEREQRESQPTPRYNIQEGRMYRFIDGVLTDVTPQAQIIGQLTLDLQGVNYEQRNQTI